MASKRKSTTPCMIPLKTMNLHEDHEPDAEEPNSRPQSPLDLLPGDEGGLDTQEGGESSGEGSEMHRGEGTFACQPCYFDSQDLNLFLDHMYSQHPDFRVEPSFSCLDCRLSTKSYESLALHNARVHPNLGARGGSSEGMAWQVGRKDGRTVVEQSLVTTDGLEGGRESEISITKTPIMKMLKGKSESKRIVVSHSGDEPDASSRSREPEEKKKEIVVTTAAITVVPNGAASKVSHPTMVHIVNSSSTIPVLKTAITQVVSVLQNRSLQQQAPTVSKSSSQLPKVMIPLSSIPTYNAAMDTNCFLKASFSKFSYPTKAELCYLTVVTKYREEQIKIWFTAQRLKQGISWSPEEIEDARRKMFSTIIQSSPRQSQQQQTITVLPASLGSNGMHHILQGSLLGQTGVIVTQPVMANGIQVSRSPMALAVTPKPQMATRPQMAVRPTAALVADKGAAMIVSTPSSINSSSSSSSINSSSSSSIKVEGSLPPIVNVTPSTRTLPSSILDPSFYKNKKSQEQLTALKQSFFRNQFPQQEEVERLTRITGLSTREVRKWFSDRRYHYRNLKGTRSFMGSVISGGVGASLLDSVDSSPSLASLSPQQHHHNTHHHHHHQQQQQAPSTPSRRTTWHQTPDFTAIRYKERDPQQVRTLEASFIANPEPSGDEVDRLRAETKMTRREIDGWFSERRKKAAADKEKQEKEEEKEEEEDYREEESSGEKARAQRREGDDKQKDSSATELKVSPIKINLKMLKVTESVNGKHGPHTTQVSPPAQTESPKVSPAMSSRSKKTPEQLHVLKQLFARTQWPSNVQYDQLSSQTGLLRSEVVRWFGDSRYVYKNGQLRWLEEYQRLADEQEKADIGALEDDQTIPKTLQGKELVETSRLKEEVQGWSSKHTTEEGETKGSVEETADGKGVQKPRDEDERSENSENSGGGCEVETSKEERTSQEPELSHSLSSAAIKLEAD